MWAVSMLPSMFQGADDFMAPIFPLAKDDVRFVGDPIVLIIARNRYVAEDAAELIEIDFDPLPPVVDWFTAGADMENKVHENRMANVCMMLGVE